MRFVAVVSMSSKYQYPETEGRKEKRKPQPPYPMSRKVGTMAKNQDRVILVTGATGRQGRAVFKHLQSKGFGVRALTRDPDQPAARTLEGHGTEIVKGDLSDPASLTRALDGVYGVFSVQNWKDGPEAETQQGINLANAANRSAISHFVYSSVASADKNTGIPHFESKFKVEEHLRGTGMPYTILRPVFFMENVLGMKEQVEQGKLALPLKADTNFQMIAVDDIGEFATLAFSHPGKWQGRAVEIASDELTMASMAEVMGRVSGQPVEYEQVPWDQFEQKAGHERTVMYRWFQDVGYHVDLAPLREENPRLAHFEPWLRAHWPQSKATAS